MLGLLKFHCLNSECKEDIPYNDLILHDKSCMYLPVVCPNCKVQIKTYQLEEHVKNECEFREVKCKVCGEDIVWKDYETHLCVCNIVRQSLIGDVTDVREFIYPGAQFVRTMLLHLGKMTEEMVRKATGNAGGQPLVNKIDNSGESEEVFFSSMPNKFSNNEVSYYKAEIATTTNTLGDEKIDKLNERLDLLFKTLSDNKASPVKQGVAHSCEDKFDKINSRLDRIEELLRGKDSGIKPEKVVTHETHYKESKDVKDVKDVKQTLNDSDIKESIICSTLIPQTSDYNVPKEIEEMFSDKLTYLENTVSEKFYDLKTDIDNYFKKEFEFIWCTKCQKIENGMSFNNCINCSNRFCKDCGLRCRECDTIYCNDCIMCPRCKDTVCLGCRVECMSCADEGKETNHYCMKCITECKNCNTTNCIDCLKTCTQCNMIICKNTICSNSCKHCYISLCKKCQVLSENPIAPCTNCKTHFSCKSCYVNCSVCHNDCCKSCVTKCKKCHKTMCTNCLEDCPSCKESYCDDCAKKTFDIKCHKCAKYFCNSCVNVNTVKCSQCKEAFCKSCAHHCRACGIGLCDTCVSRCKHCNGPSCSKCLIPCQCGDVKFCIACKEDVTPISPHECNTWLNNSPIFTSVKSRTKYPLPTSFEAKLFIEKMKGDGVNIGITDNNTFVDNSIIIVDQIWTLRLKTGMRYSTDKSIEPFLKYGAKEYDVVYVRCEDGQLYFRINDDNPHTAYTVDQSKKYYLYIENEEKARVECKVCLVYVVKI
jgi:hypothetical protein